MKIRKDDILAATLILGGVVAVWGSAVYAAAEILFSDSQKAEVPAIERASRYFFP
jgi:hypothetical protein